MTIGVGRLHAMQFVGMGFPSKHISSPGSPKMRTGGWLKQREHGLALARVQSA
jgi:hypothetical protein